MIYKPKQSADFLSEENFDEEFYILEQELARCLTEGYLTCADNEKLRYNYYISENATKNVIILHGLSEFIRKYNEIIYFFLNNGCNVFIYEQRYHGYSSRKIPNFDLVHVDSFEQYENDLDFFIKEIVLKQNSLPICLFSQSMGGAIAGLFMQRNPNFIAKAIFSAPMICPTMQNIPKCIMRIATKKEAKKFGWEAPFSHSHTFNPNVTIDQSNDLSFKRFKMNLDSRTSDIHYRGSAFSVKWLHEATLLERKLIKKSNKKIKAPILVLTGGQDKVIRLKSVIRFTKTFKNYTYKFFEGARHNLYNSTPEIMTEYYGCIKEFLKD